MRKLAENEDYVFENEDLMQLATAEAFSQAVATHFPTQFVRPALQQAPSLGGTFVTRRPRSVRRFHKYTRTPDVEVTAQIADAIPTFGGATLGAVLRASGATFPVRARLHIYQAAVGTTVPGMMRVDRRHPGGRRVRRAALAPVTPAAAGAVARTGSAWPFLHGSCGRGIALRGRAGHLDRRPCLRFKSRAPSVRRRRAWTVAPSPRACGRLLSRKRNRRRSWRRSAPDVVAPRATGDGGLQDGGRRRRRGASACAFCGGARTSNFAANLGKIASGLTGSLRKRLRAWVLPALAAWVRSNAEAFARAAAAPENGVTIRVRLTGVPGLDLLGRLPGLPGLPKLAVPKIPRGTPSINITVTAGRPKR